jgi:hypothetical protein
MARKLQVGMVVSLAAASFAFVLRGLWRWILIINSSGGLGAQLDASGRPIVHPANFDAFPYFTLAVVCGLCAIIAAMVPDAKHFSVADMLFATMLVAGALTFGVWLAS